MATNRIMNSSQLTGPPSSSFKHEKHAHRACFSCSPTLPPTTPFPFLRTWEMCPYGCVFRLSLPQHEKHTCLSMFLIFVTLPSSFKHKKCALMGVFFVFTHFPFHNHARFSNFHPSPPPSFENQKRSHLWAHFRYLSFPVMRHDERTYLGTLFTLLPLFPPLFSLFFFLVIFLYSLFRYYLFVW